MHEFNCTVRTICANLETLTTGAVNAMILDSIRRTFVDRLNLLLDFPDERGTVFADLDWNLVDTFPVSGPKQI